MCGIFGLIQKNRKVNEWETTLRKATNRLAHRGPDDAGIWYDAKIGIGFGHRRLSIVDLSPLGHQPMISASGRFVITYNGEIYNFHHLRAELETLGYIFKSNSDTEVLLAGSELWGVTETLRRANGMFAFGLWDRQELVLHLVRDRLGIKPLYYGWVGDVFVFASELKALKTLPQFENPIDRDALALYFHQNYIPAPHSIYQGIYKLPPGTFLKIRADENQNVDPQPYWSAREIVINGQNSIYEGSKNEIIEQFEMLLRDAVKIRMFSDVPLGAFLSGGIDSSILVALMQDQSSLPVRTFTIGFDQPEYNEAIYAKAVARHLGTDHTELYATPQDALNVIPRLPALYDEPFSDSSQIPTFLVSELTRRHVTVSLSGDGGDELFGGYSRYQFTWKIWSLMRLLPLRSRRVLGRLLAKIPPNWFTGSSKKIVPIFGRPGNTYDKLQKLSNVLNYETSEELYQRVISHWKNPEEIVIGTYEPMEKMVGNPRCNVQLPDLIHRMMCLDLITYLPDDILVKVDRASMGTSLEARVPLLDHRIVEFSWRLPLNLKIRNNQSKWILRQVLYRYVPKELIERPKMGFGVPIGDWLRGPLRDWAESLLDEKRIRNEGYLNPTPVRKLWQEQLSGERDWKYYLWDVLMFQAWLENTQADR